MINLKHIKNQKFSEIKLVEVLFYTFPLWFIVGNLAVSINTLLFIISSLFLIKRKQLAYRFNNSSWLLVVFFLYFFLSTSIQFLNPGLLNEKIQNWPLENNPIFKSFVLIRFLILIIVIDTLFFNKILNLKKLFFSSLICTSFVSFDVILQFIIGVDLLGYKRMGSWNPGPFGDEWIAGSYLKNFSFFSFFYVFENFKNKKYSSLLLVLIITIHLLATLLTGNRMPMILFLFGCALIILLVKNLRIVMTLSVFIFLIIFALLFKNDEYYKNVYGGLLKEIGVTKIFKNNKDSPASQDNKKTKLKKSVSEVPEELTFLRHTGYNRIFQTSIEMWKEQPWFGFGLKSFRIKCWDLLAKDNVKRKITQKHQKISCANHAHNYYLELLSEAGIIGTGLMIIFFLILLKDSFNHLIQYNLKKKIEVDLFIPVIILFFLEIWPLKSTGSFFTTWGATFFWLNAAILITAKTQKST